MKYFYKIALAGILVVSLTGIAGTAVAGAHGGKGGPKMSQQEQRCIKTWKAGKKKQFVKTGCCKLAMSAVVPPKTDRAWKDPKERKMLNMLKKAKRFCAKKGFKADMPPRGERGMPPRGERRMPPRGERGMPPRGERGMPPRGKPANLSRKCKPRKGPVMAVQRVLSEANSISYEKKGGSPRMRVGFSNKQSVVCVRGRLVPVRVGSSPSQSNLGRYIKNDTVCMLRKNRNGKRVAQLLCR
ncbi:MAG: hypothetical protein CMM44_09720 [Rhodospirillaceae bacterium]|nr:hypothetical protein [Rhodospirillaceae bacterium]|tara:strand:+ start:4449 stop:5171 length:723 start_codon:yes stop_codon:yes gene_type:complete